MRDMPEKSLNFFNTNLYAIQRQLDKLEAGGVLVSRTAGRTRLYQFKPRYPFLIELKQLLEKALSFYPEDVRENLVMNRLSQAALVARQRRVKIDEIRKWPLAEGKFEEFEKIKNRLIK